MSQPLLHRTPGQILSLTSHLSFKKSGMDESVDYNDCSITDNTVGGDTRGSFVSSTRTAGHGFDATSMMTTASVTSHSAISHFEATAEHDPERRPRDGGLNKF